MTRREEETLGGVVSDLWSGVKFGGFVCQVVSPLVERVTTVGIDLNQGGAPSLRGSAVEIADQLVEPLACGGVVRGGLEVNPLAVGQLSERGKGVCEYGEGFMDWTGCDC